MVRGREQGFELRLQLQTVQRVPRPDRHPAHLRLAVPPADLRQDRAIDLHVLRRVHLLPGKRYPTTTPVGHRLAVLLEGVSDQVRNPGATWVAALGRAFVTRAMGLYHAGAAQRLFEYSPGSTYFRTASPGNSRICGNSCSTSHKPSVSFTKAQSESPRLRNPLFCKDLRRCLDLPWLPKHR